MQQALQLIRAAYAQKEALVLQAPPQFSPAQLAHSVLSELRDPCLALQELIIA